MCVCNCEENSRCYVVLGLSSLCLFPGCCPRCRWDVAKLLCSQPGQRAPLLGHLQ